MTGRECFPTYLSGIPGYLPSATTSSPLRERRCLSGCLVSYGFADLHVHFREPGYSYKETIRTGSLAAAAGGYTCVCTMPNLNPVPDSVDNIALEQEIIDRDAVIDVLPYASITLGRRGGELVDFAALKNRAVAFSDDGSGVQDEAMMRAAMLCAASLDCVIAAHCEDNSLLRGGYIHDGRYAAAHGHKGICSESEWGPIARDIELSAETGCRYHVCHISCRESVDIIPPPQRRTHKGGQGPRAEGQLRDGASLPCPLRGRFARRRQIQNEPSTAQRR